MLFAKGIIQSSEAFYNKSDISILALWWFDQRYEWWQESELNLYPDNITRLGEASLNFWKHMVFGNKAIMMAANTELLERVDCFDEESVGTR